MRTRKEVESYLKELKMKINIFGILFLDDRGKNQQALHDLEITPLKRKDIILNITPEDYCEGPLDEKMRGILPMWIFGKTVSQKEVYIKISLGTENNNAVCISFHLSEHPLSYPLKDKKL